MLHLKVFSGLLPSFQIKAVLHLKNKIYLAIVMFFKGFLYICGQIMMKRGKNILFAINYVLLYTALIVLLVVHNTSFAAFQTQKVQKEQTCQKENKDSKTSSEKESHQVIIKELSVNALIPIWDVSLQQALIFILTLEFPVLQQIAFPFELPHTLSSYLQNTFCHHIAINAP
jgi:hypothetical protein